jgi:nicotinamidase/pyrazinamidase
MDLNKSVFWCVDAQIDFIDKDGKLPVPNAESIKPNLKKLTEFAKQKNVKVVSTMDWHYENSKELSDNPDLIETFPPHCMANTQGVRLIDEVSPEVGSAMVIDWESQKGMNFHNIHKSRNIIIRKDAFDVFQGNNMTESIVNNLGVPFLDRPTFVVYGVAGDVCVSFAVDGIMRRGYDVVLVIDAIKSLNEGKFNEKVEEWTKSTQFKTITTEQLTK